MNYLLKTMGRLPKFSVGYSRTCADHDATSHINQMAMHVAARLQMQLEGFSCMSAPI